MFALVTNRNIMPVLTSPAPPPLAKRSDTGPVDLELDTSPSYNCSTHAAHTHKHTLLTLSDILHSLKQNINVLTS